MIRRPLTVAQHLALDRVAKLVPRAKVVGWFVADNGPLLRMPDGRYEVIDRGGNGMTVVPGNYSHPVG